MDQDEFTAYFASRAGLVRRSAYVLCGDWHAADDLAQEAFLKLAASLDKVRDPTALDAYVRTCLIRAYLREQKRSWRRREYPMAAVPDGPRPTDIAEHQVRRLAVAQALRSLPPRRRAILVCRYLWDLDVETTAGILGCSAGTVKSQTARALDQLRASGLGQPMWNEGTP